MSPNNDGQNDTWKISNPTLIKDYAVTILDQGGNKVFGVSNNYNNEFDAKDVLDGVYYYFIKEGTTVKYKGTLTITR